MNRSENYFAHNSISGRTSSNTFSKNSLSSRTSSNTFSRSTRGKVGITEFSGINITSNQFGFDNLDSGKIFGQDEWGGIKHFEKLKNRP